MNYWVGTSGFSYKGWKGSFYPEDLPDKQMLAYYSQQLPAVEINNTFYRFPKAEMLANWTDQVPDYFRFVLKASRKITHSKALKDKNEACDYLFRTVRTLGAHLGVILFQLPPYLRKNAALLGAFLKLLPEDIRCTFEFRHRSWFDEEIYEMLQKKQCALCCSDTENEELSRFVATTGWGYLRLRKPDYGEADLRAWVEKVGAQPWQDAYIFFKHEDEGAGPGLARRFLELASS